MMASAPESAMAAMVRAASAQLIFENQSIESDEAFDAALMKRTYCADGNSSSVKPTLARAVKCVRPKYTESAPASMAAWSCGQ